MTIKLRKAVDDISHQLKVHKNAYDLKPLPYIAKTEETFDEILERQVDTPALEEIQRYMQ